MERREKAILIGIIHLRRFPPEPDPDVLSLERLGGQVTERIYPDMGHTINQDEIDAVKELLGSL